jgi:adenylate cyclase
MGREIERKFLVIGDEWRQSATGSLFRQGYLNLASGCTVRVRLSGDDAWLTIKGPVEGLSRPEFEYSIPAPDAREMLDTLCAQPLIEKSRYHVVHDGLTWDIDEFHGDNDGLIVAEIELADEDQLVDLPEWAGKEVTGDARYFNSSLVRVPFCRWSSEA